MASAAAHKPSNAQIVHEHNGFDAADEADREARSYDVLRAAGANDDVARRYAALYGEMSLDPTAPLGFGRLRGGSQGPRFERPVDAEQAKAYDRVLAMESQSQAEAWFVAKDVAFRQRLDGMAGKIESLRVSEPRRAVELDQEYRLGALALLNRDVYFDQSVPELMPAGFARVTDEVGLARATLLPEMLVDEQSDYFAALYRNERDDSYVYVNRGTDDDRDWSTNLTQALGHGARQYDFALNNALLIQQSPIAERTMFTGHSLGGGLASAQSFKTRIPGITFNSAGLSSLTLGADGEKRMREEPGLVSAFYVKGELLSTLQDKGPLRAGLTLAAFGSPLLGLAAYGALSQLPQAAGVRIPMDAVNDPTYDAGKWKAGSRIEALSFSQSLELHGMTQVVNSVMHRLMGLKN